VKRALLIAAGIFLLGALAFAATEFLWRGPALNVGDVAPDFTLPDEAGRPVRLADFRGRKNVVLAFYIKASTYG